MNDTYYLYQMLQIIRNPNDIELQIKLEKDLMESDIHTHQLLSESLTSNRLSKSRWRYLHEEEELDRFKTRILKSSDYLFEEDQ